MKKKILMISLMVVMLVCIFAMSVSARTDYREEQTYNYYDTEGNLLYSATTIFAQDVKSGYAGTFRYEVIIRESGEGFAKFDENGIPLTWYVVSDDKLDDIIGGASLEQDGVQNITVTSVPTLDSSIATVDKDGKYTYKQDTDGVYFSKKVVSANFFTTGVKSFNGNTKFEVTSLNGKTNGPSGEFCKMTDSGYLLCLYLPKTLTGMPDSFCKRSTLRVLEFEDNTIAITSFPKTAFQFCANLKSLTVPEGIKTIVTESFRECIGLTYVKLANSMERMENNAFSRCSYIETFIMGKNMTFCGYLYGEIVRFFVEDERPSSAEIKYYYVSPYLNEKGDFDSYRGAGTNAIMYGEYRNVIFMFSGDLAQAAAVANYTGDSFKATLYSDVAKKKGWTYNEAITYETYIANKEYYDTEISGHLLVYDVPECIAFYDGHDMESQNTYKDVLTSFEIGEACERCGKMENGTEYAPVLEFLGYSAQIDGDLICMGYRVNAESRALFPELSYGILAAAPAAGDVENYEPLNPDLTTNGEGKVAYLPVDGKYSEFNFIIKGFSSDSSYYEKSIVMCAYVINGDKVDYLCHDELNEVSQQEYATSVTYKFIAEECIPKYAVTFSCDSNMGELTGETSQIVKDGETATTVTAVAKEGYQFACWSDGTQTATIEYAPSKKADLVAYFTPASTGEKGLPVITINTDGGVEIASKDYYVGCEITLLDTETGNSIGGKAAEIKGRGNSTWDRFDKKPYKFKFDSKQNLFGYGKEKTWVLLADARDYSLVRNMLALNAGLTMSELGYTSHGQSVELYLNGEYRGVYYLCEQIQVKENRVNITQEDDEIEQGPADLGYLVEMDAWAADSGNQSGTPNYTADGDVYVTVPDSLNSNRAYTIKDPEDILFNADGTINHDYLDYIQGYLAQCIAAVQGTDYAAVCELIDVKSFAQSYIIFELFKNPDVNYSSVYFYKDVNGKLISAPLWDFDMAVGNVTHKANSGTNAQNFRDTTFLWTAAQNPWFKALLKFDEFKALVGQELADNADTLRASISADIAYAKEHGEAYKKNFEVWDLIGNTSATEKMGAWSVPDEFKAFTTWEEHLDYIANYLEESLAYLITTYPAPAAE